MRMKEQLLKIAARYSGFDGNEFRDLPECMDDLKGLMIYNFVKEVKAVFKTCNIQYKIDFVAANADQSSMEIYFHITWITFSSDCKWKIKTLPVKISTTQFDRGLLYI